jgi:hypothetical protein
MNAYHDASSSTMRRLLLIELCTYCPHSSTGA